MMKPTALSQLLLPFVVVVLVLARSNNRTRAFQLTSRSSSRPKTTLSVSTTSLLPEEIYNPTQQQQQEEEKDGTGIIPAAMTTHPTIDSNIELLSYEHDGYTLKYRYKPAAVGRENEPPLLLVHPVGIGMSSWFWDAFLDEWEVGGAVYAPDLIGCGIDHGSDAWVPEKKGMFFPTSWVEGCETLLNDIILPQTAQGKKKNNPLLASLLGGLPNSNNSQKQHVTVVTQGGLAPVGVMLASRNPQTVSNLIMTSPPTWNDMTVPVQEKELEKNYNFLKSPLGSAAFGALESEWAIRFFSNLFLFEGQADSKWMQQCLLECQYQEARPPIQAFNAGLMQHRSYRDELTSLEIPTTILQGKGDANRIPQRDEYANQMKDCTIVTLPKGLNVLPWECPDLFAKILQQQRRAITA